MAKMTEEQKKAREIQKIRYALWDRNKITGDTAPQVLADATDPEKVIIGLNEVPYTAHLPGLLNRLRKVDIHSGTLAEVLDSFDVPVRGRKADPNAEPKDGKKYYIDFFPCTCVDSKAIFRELVDKETWENFLNGEISEYNGAVMARRVIRKKRAPNKKKAA